MLAPAEAVAKDDVAIRIGTDEVFYIDVEDDDIHNGSTKIFYKKESRTASIDSTVTLCDTTENRGRSLGGRAFDDDADRLLRPGHRYFGREDDGSVILFRDTSGLAGGFHGNHRGMAGSGGPGAQGNQLPGKILLLGA